MNKQFKSAIKTQSKSIPRYVTNMDIGQLQKGHNGMDLHNGKICLKKRKKETLLYMI